MGSKTPKHVYQVQRFESLTVVGSESFEPKFKKLAIAGFLMCCVTKYYCGE